MNKWSMYGCVIFTFIIFMAGCTKQATVPDDGLISDGSSSFTGSKQEDLVTSTNKEDAVVSDESPGAEGSKTKTTLSPAYFDFDSWVLSTEARETIRKNYEWMKANPGANIRIEGYTDERGSDSYNLALGESRAKSAMKYVITLGADPSRVSIISYGEENPVDPDQNEQAWAKNRRAEFVVQ